MGLLLWGFSCGAACQQLSVGLSGAAALLTKSNRSPFALVLIGVPLAPFTRLLPPTKPAGAAAQWCHPREGALARDRLCCGCSSPGAV